MKDTQMTQTETIAKIAEKLETKAQAQAAFNAVITAIADALKDGEPVTLKDLGSFKIIERAARKGRNPRTGEEIDIPASKTVKFTPAKVLKDALANGK